MLLGCQECQFQLSQELSITNLMFRRKETEDTGGYGRSWYSPLQAARQLRGSGSGNIAVVVPTITNNFFAQLVDSIEKTCRQYHYRTLIVQTYGEKESEESAMNLLKMQHADGVILCAIENDWDKLKSYGRIMENLSSAMNIIRTRKFRWYAADSMKGFIKLRNIFWKKDIERLHIVQEQEQ